MTKQRIESIREKNTVIDNIIRAFAERKEFLICGHTNPDEDCISSMVAVAILLTRFDKNPRLFIPGDIPKNIHYLINICSHNSIKILTRDRQVPNTVDTIIACDTPKRAMLDSCRKIDSMMTSSSVLTIEIDHHLGADSNYIGDGGYCLVTEASSASELIGYIALKLRKKKDLLSRFMISDPFSRNFVLAVLTGIIGDTNMGKYIKSRREKKYYDIFTAIYDDILMTTTVRESNLTSSEDIYRELRRLSEKEEQCYQYISDKKVRSGPVAYAVLSEEDMEYLFTEFERDIVTTVTKSIANDFAETTKRIGLIVFPDEKGTSDLIQFRMRRSQDYKEFDLRKVIEIFAIANGGGHEGAIGFRFPKSEMQDPEGYAQTVIDRLKKELA